MKHYKCGFSHCAHADGKVAEDEAVKIGTRYWHKDCYEVSETIKDIRETYLDKISSSVVVSALNKIINNIVFGKKLENKKITKAQSNLEAARYLQFCIDYALEHKIPITHAPGLYYLIDNVRVKKAYEKKNELEMQKEMKKQMDVEIESKPVDTTVKPTTNFSAGSGNFGFGNILGGMNE